MFNLKFISAAAVLCSATACSDPDATLFVYAPRTTDVVVEVDGLRFAQVRPAAFEKVPLKKGKHTITLRTPAGFNTQEVHIASGTERLFMRPNGSHCYVLVDVSSAYVAEGQAPSTAPPTVALRVVDDAVQTLPPNVVFGGFASKIEADAKVHTMVEAPCAAASQSDDAALQSVMPVLEQAAKRARGRL